ncbi:MAG: hypothetical protein ACREVC_03460 [Burkholderiales bacterium]
MRRPPRIVFLTAALAALALWVVVDSRSRSGSIVEMRPAVLPARPARQEASIANGDGARLELAPRAALRPLGTDPFRPESWSAAAQAPRRKAAIVAPPLPFRYVGRVYLNSESMVFIKRGAKLLVIRKGDTLDGNYLVESVGQTGITFLYRPSGTRQTLRIGAPIDGAHPAS